MKIESDYLFTFNHPRPSLSQLNMTVSDEHLTKYTFNRNVQFIVPAQVYLGGTSNTAESTGGRVTKNFQGTLADVRMIVNDVDYSIVNVGCLMQFYVS